jgi:hypothetical protein
LVLAALAPNPTLRVEGEFRLRCLEDGAQSNGTTEAKQATAFGGEVLVVAGPEAKEVAELVMASAHGFGRTAPPNRSS